MKCIPRIVLVFLFMSLTRIQAQSITNFTTSKTIYDCIGVGSLIWVATSGGFYIHDFATGASSLRPANPEFPDPSIRALAVDSLGNMWIASHEGYLMARDANWDEYINYSYVSAGWRINALAAYRDYLIIGSDKGVSLFDIKKKVAVKNAQQIGSSSFSKVFTMAIHKNHLYVGGEAGSARLKVKLQNLSSANFYDPSLWEVDSSIAPVYSFYEDSGEIVPASGPTGRMFGILLTTHSDSSDSSDSDTTWIIIHSEKPDSFTVASKVTTIRSIGVDRCVIGTEEDYFYYWDAAGVKNMKIPGPTFESANRVHVDRTGKLWVLPYGDPNVQPEAPDYDWYPMPWWLGINSFNGATWKLYSPMDILGMGHMGGSTEANAIAETDDGRMWFGFTGGSIKSYDPQKDEWWHYCNFGKGGDGDGAFVKRAGPCPSADWAKCDAIAQDSSGYMWFGSWNNSFGCLLCYKPAPGENEELTGRYRRFPPYGHPDLNITITCIAVDPEQNILFGTEDGELSVVRHNGHPFRDGIMEVAKFRNLQNVYRIIVLGDGTSLVLTASGVMLFDPSELTLSPMEDFEKGISVLAVENDNLFWYAVANKGVVRFNILDNEKTVYGRAQGLFAGQVNDLFVDRKNGCVWVATDRGVSRIALGYSSPANGVKPPVVVFPNPFSFKRHTTINFRNIPGDAKVGVYSLGGHLVGSPAVEIGNESSSLFRWKPSSHIAPGTYFYSIVTSTEKKTGKLLLVP